MNEVAPQPVYSFGAFRLFPRTRVLQDNGRDVRLGSRAVELLTALVERGGEVAPSGDLIARVWPTTTVDEQNLRVQIAGLRKALADGHGDERFIATVPGRGYCFVAPIATGSVAHHESAPVLRSNLPAALTRLFGRSEVVEDLRRRLGQERLVSIVGPGGVGKTSVAVAVAHEVSEGRAWFADLAPVSDPRLVPTTLLEAFGLTTSPDNVVPALARHLEGQNALLVLDNCEHLIESCASTAEALLGAIKDLRILTTSRESLRAAAERVIRLPALETPELEASLEIASTCSAVQLFIQRASSGDDRFSLTEDTLPAVIDICRRLDGMPLALELAAAAVGALGVRGVAQRLREQLELPNLGRRTAAARQATLRATLEWSYQLLSPAEQRALRRLSVFQGAFDLDSAAAVVGPSADASMLTLLAALAEKSLLSVDLSREEARYRLLQTTRNFALERLTPREMGATRARHAREMQRLAEATDRAWGMGDSALARRDSADLIDDLSAAIDWALSPLGDIGTAADLVVAATPLLRRLSLLEENARLAELALDKVRSLSPPNPTAEMRLLGSYLVPNYRHENRDRIIPAAERLMDLAEEMGDAGQLIIGAWARMVAARHLSEDAALRRCAERLVAAGPRSPETYQALAYVSRCHLLLEDGALAEARRATEAGLGLVTKGLHHVHVARLGLDPGVYLYELLVRICWLQGFTDQSLAAGRACVNHFRQLSQERSLVYVLTSVAAVAALLVGDLDAAAAFLDESQRLCDERGEDGSYYARSQASMQTMLRFARTKTPDHAAVAIVAADSSDVVLTRTPLVVRIAEALGASHSPADGLAALETVEAWATGDSGWIQPELLRVRAALLWRAGNPAPEVKGLLQQSLSQSRKMGALMLELRTATTLAELLAEEGRPAEALTLLIDIIDRMPEGHEAVDCRRAAALRDTLLGL